MEPARPSDSPPATRTPWMLLSTLGLAVFASVTAELLPPAVVLGMTETLDVDASAIGALVTVWAATIVLGTFPMVRLTARWPRKTLVVAALIVFAAANAVVALVPVFAVVVGARIVSALMAAVTWAVIFGYVPTLVSRDRLGRAMAVVLGGGTLASVLGVPIGAFLAAAGSWQLAFAAVAVVLLIAAVVAARRLPAHAGSSPQRGARARADGSLRGVLLLLAAGALLLTGYMTLYAYVVPVLVNSIGLSGTSASGVLFAAGAAGALGLLVSGVGGDRWPTGALLGVVAAIPLGAALVLIALLAGTAPAVPVAGVTLIGFGAGGLPPLFQARVTRVASPEVRPLATSSFVVVLNAGIALGSAVGAVLFTHGGATVLTTTAVALGVVSLLAFVATSLTVGEHQPETERVAPADASA